mmetsp:Transcript_463/g.961  ORF Transcript_463/g.961 Transcript_463/m.961 type:complete len:86 (-) Transcript_463:52-309(-)
MSHEEMGTRIDPRSRTFQAKLKLKDGKKKDDALTDLTAPVPSIKAKSESRFGAVHLYKVSLGGDNCGVPFSGGHSDMHDMTVVMV